MTDWRVFADRAAGIVGTPCYLISESRIHQSLAQLQSLQTSVRLRHWLSLKTQPVARLVKMAIDLGLGVDVVSEYELASAVSSGTPATRILVNGIGKHQWLTRNLVPELTVHFDSLAEVKALAMLAKALNWRVGLRCAIPSGAGTRGMVGSSTWDQFGMTSDEVRVAASMLAGAGVTVSGLHFHLHTNMQRVEDYRAALQVVTHACELTGLQPSYIDIGGGMPIEGEEALDGVSAADTFRLGEMREWLATIPDRFPSVSEVWLENGRFLTGASGALVVTVQDRKERDDVAYLICDGGRVNHARNSSIEKHQIAMVPTRTGRLMKTVVCGPTCSAVDRLGSWMLPESIEPGDRIIWLTAGAYHIPLETRFSTGLAPVVWFNDQEEPEVIRRRETAAQWWSQWTSSECEQLAPDQLIL